MFGSRPAQAVVGRGWHVPPAVVTMFVLVAASGCGDGDAPASGPIVQDSAGIRIVTSADDGAWEASERWRFEEEVRIGVDSGEEELQFGMVGGIDADADGRIYVLDQQARRIRVFDEDGVLVHAFGRSGGGPGELSQGLAQPPGGLLIDETGAVAVPDLGNQRLSRFTPEGEVLESPRLEIESGIPLVWTRSGDRTIHYQVRRMDMGAGAATGAQPMDEILRLQGGSGAESVASFPAGETFTMTAGGLPEIRIFAPENVWAVLEDGRIVIGSNAEYSLAVRGADGEIETIVRRAVERRPVTPRAEGSMRSLFQRAWEEAGVPAAMVGPLMENLHFEPLWPSLAQLLAGPDATLWVQRVDPASTLEDLTMDDLQAGRFGSPAWDVFGRDGAYLGTVEMPTGISPMRFVGDHLYGVHRDELEVQRVVRLRLVRGD